VCEKKQKLVVTTKGDYKKRGGDGALVLQRGKGGAVGESGKNRKKNKILYPSTTNRGRNRGKPKVQTWWKKKDEKGCQQGSPKKEVPKTVFLQVATLLVWGISPSVRKKRGGTGGPGKHSGKRQISPIKLRRGGRGVP